MPEDDFVSLKIIQTLLEVQATAFKDSFKLMFEGLRDELKDVKKDISDLKESLSFSQGQLDTNIKKVEEMDVRTSFFESSLNTMSENLDSIKDSLEYQENMSRRNNVKLVGFPESEESESWDQSEEILKSQVKDVLGIEEDLDIERAHRVGQKKEFFTRRDGSKVKAHPRPIVAKFKSWKQREKIIKAAKSIRPANVKFLEDFSKRTLDKRAAKVSQLEAARKQGKTAFFVAGRLVIKDKPPDVRYRQRNQQVASGYESDGEVSIRPDITE